MENASEQAAPEDTGQAALAEPALDTGTESVSHETTPPDTDADSVGEDSPNIVDGINLDDIDPAELGALVPEGMVEIEYEGETYHVPEPIKGAVLRQKDYTQKTQAVAEMRKTLDNEIIKFRQTQQIQGQLMESKANLAAVDRQLAEYEGVDWTAAQRQDPENANAAFMSYQQLKLKRESMAGEIQAQEQQVSAFQRQELAKTRQQSWEVLANEIDGWSEKTANELGNYGKKSGLSPAGLTTLHAGMHGADTVPMMKILNKAMRYDQLMEKAKAVKKPPIKDAQPAGKVKGNKPGAKRPEDMSTAEYIAWADKQEQKKRKAGLFS